MKKCSSMKQCCGFILYWLISLLIVVGALVMMGYIYRKAPVYSPPKGGGPKTSAVNLRIERTDGLNTNDSMTAMHINPGTDQRALQFTIYGASSTDVTIHTISFQLSNAILPLDQIDKIQLVADSDSGMVLDVDSALSSGFLMNVDYVIPQGSTKVFWLLVDLKPTAPPYSNFTVNLFDIQASDNVTNNTVDVLRIPGLGQLSWTNPVYSAAVLILP